MQQSQLRAWMNYLLILTIILGVFQQISFNTANKKEIVSQPNNNHKKIQKPIIQQQQPVRIKKTVEKPKKQGNQDSQYLDKIVQNQHYIQEPQQLKFIISTQYANQFQQIKQQINNMYPQVIITSQQYPLSPTQQAISKILDIMQYGLIGITLVGGRVQAIARNPLYIKFMQNRWTFMIGYYLGINFLRGIVGKSGAFQVYLQNNLIFSKLQSNRLPSAQQIRERL